MITNVLMLLVMFIRRSLPAFSDSGYRELTTTVEVQSTTADSEVISASTTSHQPDLVTYATASSTEKNSTGNQLFKRRKIHAMWQTS